MVLALSSQGVWDAKHVTVNCTKNDHPSQNVNSAPSGKTLRTYYVSGIAIRSKLAKGLALMGSQSTMCVLGGGGRNIQQVNQQIINMVSNKSWEREQNRLIKDRVSQMWYC